MFTFEGAPQPGKWTWGVEALSCKAWAGPWVWDSGLWGWCCLFLDPSRCGWDFGLFGELLSQLVNLSGWTQPYRNVLNMEYLNSLLLPPFACFSTACVPHDQTVCDHHNYRSHTSCLYSSCFYHKQAILRHSLGKACFTGVFKQSKWTDATRMSMMEEEVMSVRDSEGPCDPGKAPYPTEERDFLVRRSVGSLYTDILVKPIWRKLTKDHLIFLTAFYEITTTKANTFLTEITIFKTLSLEIFISNTTIALYFRNKFIFMLQKSAAHLETNLQLPKGKSVIHWIYMCVCVCVCVCVCIYIKLYHFYVYLKLTHWN